MFKASRRALLRAAFAVTALLAVPAAQAQNNEPIKIGLLFSFTGPAAQGAANFLAVSRLAAKEINDSGGLLGRKVELIEADHGFDPARAVSEARRLTQQVKVDVVFGPEGSALGLAVAPIFNEAKIPYFSTTVTPAPTPYNFTSLMSGLTQATAMLDFSAGYLHAKTVAVIADAGGLGKQLNEDVKKLAPSKGVQVVASQEYDIKATDMTPQLLSLRRLNPDVLLHTGSLPLDGGTLINNLKELGWNPTIVSAVFGQSTIQVMQVSGPDSFKSGKYWGLLPKAFTYCAKDKVGDRAYDRYLNRIKAFDPEAYAKIDHKVSLYIYDPIFLWKAAVEATKTLDGTTLVRWIEQNGSKLKTNGAGYPIDVSASSHFMLGPNSVTFVQRPDLVRPEDKLVERIIDCP
jgi:ABC-type branched-subunit amino acid transport system substrate-binding protein